MEYPKIINLIDEKSDNVPKSFTTKWLKFMISPIKYIAQTRK